MADREAICLIRFSHLSLSRPGTADPLLPKLSWLFLLVMLGLCSAQVPRVFLWPRCTWNPTFGNCFSPVTRSQKRRDNNGLAPRHLEDDTAHECPSFAADPWEDENVLFSLSHFACISAQGLKAQYFPISVTICWVSSGFRSVEPFPVTPVQEPRWAPELIPSFSAAFPT